jgi:hypothetical protein
MANYLHRRTDVVLKAEYGARFEFSDAEFAMLPRTARGKIKKEGRAVRVRSACVFARTLPKVRVAVWDVETAESAAGVLPPF